MPTHQTPEHDQIANCLTGIRRRLWLARLLERTTLAVQWGALIALPLTASTLLRHGLSWENKPWTSYLLTCLPLGAAFLLLRKFTSNKLALSPTLIRITAGLTAAWSICMFILHQIPLENNLPIWSIPLAIISTYILLAATTVKMINNQAAAIFVDQRRGLQERVSTALEMLQTPARSTLETAFRAPVIASAIHACQQVRTTKVPYHRLDSRLYASAALVSIAAAAITLIPPLPARAVTTHKPSTIIVRQGKDLREVLKEIEEKKLPGDTVTPEKIKPLQTALTQLQNGTMSPIESSALLSETKEQLRQEQAQMEASQQVAAALKDLSQTRDLAKAADELKDAQMAKAQGDATATQKEQNAANAIKSAAAAAAEKMAAGQMSEQEKKDLAANLQAAADKAKADPQLQNDLQKAADAAKSGDAQKLSQSLADAGQRMGQQSADQQLSQGAMSKAMSEIDQMQNQSGGQNSQSTMGNGGMPNDPNGNGNQGQDGNQNQNGSQARNGGQNPGQDGNPSSGGTGQQPGGSQSQAAAGNSGQMGPDSGSSTMIENKGGSGGGEQRPLGDVKSFVRVYDPRATDTNGNKEKVGSFINPIHAAAGSMEVMGSADDKTSQIKNYADVLPEARQQAMDEMNRQEYPPQYQDMVRQFYNDPAAPGAPK